MNGKTKKQSISRLPYLVAKVTREKCLVILLLIREYNNEIPIWRVFFFFFFLISSIFCVFSEFRFYSCFCCFEGVMN